MTHVEDADSAGTWFVRLDADGTPSAVAEAVEWLAEDAANERAFERVELAVELGRRLAADAASPLHTELARALEDPQRTGRRRVVASPLVWGGAMAAALIVGVFVAGRAPPAEVAPPVAIEAARVVTFDAPSNPVAVLPSGAVVDASAVAVLPFAAPGDAALANGLEHDIVAALRGVPGLYVIADAAVSSYAYTDLEPYEIGAQLGARGIVDAAVELGGGRVRVSARLRDAATGATLWQTAVDRSVDELYTVRDEIAETVAATMLDSSLRPPLVRADGSSASFATSKPFAP